ncbi:transporter, major facilitator family protein [Dictyocaulus viviparus]|uniref:Transporter, major facilitator family protein n=1 Tax=Dictyocaulus viviparus TaxID=29172 RepID=A0A0D8XZD2_DICVI|nr:transporter, major facilitator family protein [Dictyocaulus viviparus]
MSAVHPVSYGMPPSPQSVINRWFPSWRLLTASLLSLCFASVHMMNSNMGMAVVCMVNSTEYFDDEDVTMSRDAALRLNWTSQQEGYIFSAFNVGLLLMLLTGFIADKFNAKYMIMLSVNLAIFANILIAKLSPISVYFAIVGRFLVGLADALLQPAVNSLITRWFPNSERSYALGLATGGRQLGTLIVIPISGALCAQTDLFGGWPAIFYLSTVPGIFFIVIYSIIGADKPSKQTCITASELKYIMLSNANEDVGMKRTERKVPWTQILSSPAVWASVIAVICHEFPLMTMIMFLPSYLHDVHHYTSTKNGILSSLPTASLLLSKLASSYANTWLQHHTQWKRSTICKVLNSLASLGLGSFLLASTLLDSSRAPLAVLFLCLSMASAGLHTPGCQTALVSLAPAYSGVITGITFFFVACSGIVNPILTKWIARNGLPHEWNMVFYISTAIALLPIVVFNIWGSAETQWWAKKQKNSNAMQRSIP